MVNQRTDELRARRPLFDGRGEIGVHLLRLSEWREEEESRDEPKAAVLSHGNGSLYAGMSSEEDSAGLLLHEFVAVMGLDGGPGDVIAVASDQVMGYAALDLLHRKFEAKHR